VNIKKKRKKGKGFLTEYLKDFREKESKYVGGHDYIAMSFLKYLVITHFGVFSSFCLI
jgi:hypothetical protein